MPKVLIVEDDEVIADGMARHLRASSFDPVWVGNGRTALARLRYEGADVCVLLFDLGAVGRPECDVVLREGVMLAQPLGDNGGALQVLAL